MWINANLDQLNATEQIVLANNRQVLAFKKTWALQKGNSILPSIFSWQQYLQETWRNLYANTSKRFISTIESRFLISQVMNDLNQIPDNRLLDEVIKNINYCHAHLINAEQLLQSHNPNCILFVNWMQKYQQTKLKNALLDINDLSGLIINATTHITPIIIYGFKTLTPEQSRLFDHIGYQVLDVKQPNQNSNNLCFQTTDDEILSAAKWARELHQAQPEKHIAIVSPTLNNTHHQIKSIFNQVFNDTLVETGQKSYNISLGLPLVQYPLVEHALNIFQLSQQLARHIDTNTFNSVITSPYIAGAKIERSTRSMLVNRVLSLSKTHFELEKIDQYLLNTPQLKCLIDTVLTRTSNTHQSHEKWLLDFNNYLQDWGFATDRGLSSTEYQVFNKFQQSSLGLNQLMPIGTKITALKALNALKNWLSQVIFQAQSSKTPIQILGSLEAEGLYFDNAWVLGMNDDFLPANLNSPRFITTDIAVQHQIPHSNFSLINQDAQNTRNNLINLSNKVICSYAKTHFQSAQQASPLFTFDDAINMPKDQYQPVIMENLDDVRAEQLTKTKISGGVSVLKDQMACAFKGFAHRLNIQHFDAPHIGLSRSEQGDIVHRILEKIYQQLRTHEQLINYPQNELDTLITGCIDQVLSHYLQSSFTQVEKSRLAQLLHQFITIEKQRDGFSVVETEQAIEANIAGLCFKTRLDRVDKLDNGERIIFDYKTGNIPSNPWCARPIKEPQLPIYITNHQAHGVAFIQITTDQVNYVGLAKNPGSLPNKAKQQRACETWDDQLKLWQQQLEQASTDYQQGKAAVLPSKYACQYCKFDSLCRIEK